jgi:microsomal epoxide hydrolase
MTPAIARFQVAVPEQELLDLHQRLSATRWPDQISGSGWDYGTDLTYVQNLADYWATRYDWRHHEAELNSYPQFVTDLLGDRVHFYHVRSAETEALPLILTHGWPGSVVEFVKLLGPLTDPMAHGGDPSDAFHLVVPSLPGYGFSGPTTQRGWSLERVARAWAELMNRLGYRRYGAQGGDWGSGISRYLAGIDPEHVCGVHVNMIGGSPPGLAGDFEDLTDRERAAFSRAERIRDTGRGYVAIQSTRPQTLAYGLTDSPAGLLSWIIEKFWEWTDNEGRPEDAIARDQLLTNASVYWFSRTAGSAARLYYETFGGRPSGRPDSAQMAVRAPLGVALFPKETHAVRRSWVETTNNLIHWSEFDRGGHFPALEEPDLLIEDIRQFFRLVR